MINRMNWPKVAIIMLNWNSSEETIECLESLYGIDYPEYEILVIDNKSTDNSIQNIIDYCHDMKTINSPYIKTRPDNKPISYIRYTKIEAEQGGTIEKENALINVQSNKKLIIVENDRNYGFPEGNNIGIRYTLKKGYPYILLLNNDVVVHKNFLSQLVLVMEKDQNIVMAGSKIYDYYNPERIQCVGGTINLPRGCIREILNVRDSKKYDQVMEKDCVWATSALFRREIFQQLGGLDPFFFFGIEEYDYCARIKNVGKKVVYVGSSHIWHKKGASAKKLDADKSMKEKILTQRGVLYHKHFYRLFQKHIHSPMFIVPYVLYMLKKISYYPIYHRIYKRIG
jgi:GT2 family glycosyltransferase